MKNFVKNLFFCVMGVSIIIGCDNGSSLYDKSKIESKTLKAFKEKENQQEPLVFFESDSLKEESKEQINLVMQNESSDSHLLSSLNSSESFEQDSIKPNNDSLKEHRKAKKVLLKNENISSNSLVSKDSIKELCIDVPKGSFCDSRDGEIYQMVRIGSQVWMAENLRFSVNGSWCYNNRVEYCKTLGRLYSWTSAVDLNESFRNAYAKENIKPKHKGICPLGFHVPSKMELETLVSYVERKNSELIDVVESVGTSLKSVKGWTECDKVDEECAIPTNRYGFNALPSGRRNADGTFDDMKNETGFWTSDESENASHAPYFSLYYATDKFWGSYSNKKSVGYSVRCLKD